MKHGWIPVVCLLAVACQPPVQPAAENETTRLMRGCGETSRLLGQMKTAERSFQYDEAGNATISNVIWSDLPAPMKDAMVKAIAYHAICSSNEPGEQMVTIRSSESSEILAQQTVDEFVR